jgi:hypothetical protein
MSSTSGLPTLQEVLSEWRKLPPREIMATKRPNDQAEFNLLLARKYVFALLLKRLGELHVQGPSPESFYVGQPYVEDKAGVDCVITANFNFPGHISPFDFWLYKAHIYGLQSGNILHIQIHRKISQRLWDDIRLCIPFNKHLFIVGYLNACMPSINRILLDNRYYHGHLLSRTFSVFEVLNLNLTVAHRRMRLAWPVGAAYYPPSQQIAKDVSALYVHDYIDSIDSYFRSDYDDCIRRVVTSAENLFEALNWKVKPAPLNLLQRIVRRLMTVFGVKVEDTPNTFRRLLLDNIDKRRISADVLSENMLFIYTVRNRIVHSGFRMSTSSRVFCEKAITTLKHLITGHCGDRVIVRYVDTLNMQFGSQRNPLEDHFNLDVIENWVKNRTFDDPKSIESGQELNRFLFEALRFTERDKHAISRS